MATLIGRQDIGLFDNGSFESGKVTNFWGGGEIYSGDAKRGRYSYRQNTSAQWLGEQRIEVDTTKTYTLSYSLRTLNRDSAGNLSRSYLGFACFDQFDNFCELRTQGGVGDTYLSRPLNPGDPYAYIQSSSGWYTGANVTTQPNYFRHLVIFPATHPLYYRPHYYSRIGLYEYNIIYKSLVQTEQGDWQMKLSNYSDDSDLNMPNIGYPLPAGTPVSRGAAGGTYNYAFGYREYPETWTTYQVTFTGESRNSDVPFRYATKYIRFMILGNYAMNNVGGTYPYPQFLMDDLILIENKNGKQFNFTY